MVEAPTTIVPAVLVSTTVILIACGATAVLSAHTSLLTSISTIASVRGPPVATGLIGAFAPRSSTIRLAAVPVTVVSRAYRGSN